ncbi:MAG: uroporphyrinogen-III synthase [Simkaniaceae bacterium]|nr:uroporphyrinogen-III synthase [Simkaniaceae bacterium]
MKEALYLGLDPTNYQTDSRLTHLPIIEIVPRCSSEIRATFSHLSDFTHIIFTSKTAVNLFCKHFEELRPSSLDGKKLLAIGAGTAKCMQEQGLKVDKIAEYESQEGMIELLESVDLTGANILLPRSAIARPLLTHFLVERGVRHQVCILYDTVTRRPKEIPDLRNFDEVIFTSPSTVDAFLRLWRHLPKKVRPISIGPVTQNALHDKLLSKNSR